MSDEFFRTRMGAKFYDSTMPRIASGLERLATAAERIASALERIAPAVAPAPVSDQADDPSRKAAAE